MKLKNRIDSFSKLGVVLRNALDGIPGRYTNELNSLISNQQARNPWFTPENVRMALRSVANELTDQNLEKWTASYKIPDSPHYPLNVGVIMAGNIPLVGFHDFISVLITGNRVIAKPSSRDEDLISFVGKLLSEINPGFSDRMEFRRNNLSEFDIVIATGSNNSSRYFEYYFGRYPHIIRKNRNSAAVIEGNETDEELKLLGVDVFSYFGLGCRNISKLFVPSGFDIQKLADLWSSYSSLLNHNKYGNNYDFNKALFLVNRESFTDLGFILLKMSDDLFSPVAVLNYKYYSSLDEVEKAIKLDSDRIQCISGRKYTPFGMSQSPKLWDYADGIDTVEFLLKKNRSGIL
jgi:hypothetical protein